MVHSLQQEQSQVSGQNTSIVGSRSSYATHVMTTTHIRHDAYRSQTRSCAGSFDDAFRLPIGETRFSIYTGSRRVSLKAFGHMSAATVARAGRIKDHPFRSALCPGSGLKEIHIQVQVSDRWEPIFSIYFYSSHVIDSTNYITMV